MMFFNEIGGMLNEIAFWLIYCLFVLPIVLSGSLDSLLDILSLLRWTDEGDQAENHAQG